MCCRFAILGGSDEIAEIAVLGNSRVRQQLIRLLLRMAAVRSCVAVMLSSVAESAGSRRASVWTRLAGGSNGGNYCDVLAS